MKKKNDIILILIMILIVLCILGGIIFFAFKFLKGMPIHGQINTNQVYNNVYEQKFETINIDSKAAYIEIKESSNNQFKLTIYDNDSKNLSIENSDQLLEIKLNTEPCKGLFCFNSLIPKIELYVPKEYKNSITINNKYGDIDIDAYISKLNIKEDCGDIKVRETDNITAKNALGDIKIEKINHSLDIINNCGDIKIYDLILEVDSQIKDDLGDIRLSTTNDIYIDAKTELGDVKINSNNKNSNVTLKIRNDMGDIIVNN